MTLTERRANPAVMDILIRTLTENEMDKVSGGDLGDDLRAVCNMAKCQLGIHDWYFTNTYQNWVYCQMPMKAKIYSCRRCGVRKLGPTEYE